jgi:sec-independent protein translocase protein TatB
MGTPLPVELDILGWSDSLILMVLALVVFGPRRLPQIGRQIGKLMYEFRKASNEFKFQMEEELRAAEEADRRKREEERLKALALKAPAAEVPATPAGEAAGSANREETAYSSNAEPAESQPADSSATPTQPTEPRILPPSTGEPVAASRPAGSVAPFEFHDESAAGTNGSGPERQLIATPESPAHEPVPAQAETEQAANHG